jgi:hypothetical protein
MKTQDLETQDTRLEVCDHPKMPHSLRVLEEHQALLDGGIKRAEAGCRGWPMGPIALGDLERGTAVEKHNCSLGLALVRNFEGCTLAAVIDGLMVEQSLRCLVNQTVAMLPRWAAEKLPGLWGSAPQSVKYTRNELNAFVRWGLISGLNYDESRRCLMWEGTELLRLVVKKTQDLETQDTRAESGEVRA